MLSVRTSIVNAKLVWDWYHLLLNNWAFSFKCMLSQYTLKCVKSRDLFYMHHPTVRIEHTMFFVTLVMEYWVKWKERNFLFMVMWRRHMVKDHSDNKRGNLLLLFPISSKGSFDSTYHGLCYTSCGEMVPPWRIDPLHEWTLVPWSYISLPILLENTSLSAKRTDLV